jgi:hypothetical protein
MKKVTGINILAIFTTSLLISSCSVVGGIFKTGVGVGVFLSALVVIGIIILVIRMGKKE